MKKKLSIRGGFDIYTHDNRKKIINYIPKDDYFHTYLINGVIVLHKGSEIDYKNVYEYYKLAKLPLPEKKGNRDLNLVPINGGTNKAATIANEQKIFFNKDFFSTLNLFEKAFVIGHELGHRFFYNENYCDLFACHFCIRNFIDLRFVNFDKLLSNKDRKDYIYNIFKIKRYER